MAEDLYSDAPEAAPAPAAPEAQDPATAENKATTMISSSVLPPGVEVGQTITLRVVRITDGEAEVAPAEAEATEEEMPVEELPPEAPMAAPMPGGMSEMMQ